MPAKKDPLVTTRVRRGKAQLESQLSPHTKANVTTKKKRGPGRPRKPKSGIAVGKKGEDVNVVCTVTHPDDGSREEGIHPPSPKKIKKEELGGEENSSGLLKDLLSQKKRDEGLSTEIRSAGKEDSLFSVIQDLEPDDISSVYEKTNELAKDCLEWILRNDLQDQQRVRRNITRLYSLDPNSAEHQYLLVEATKCVVDCTCMTHTYDDPNTHESIMVFVTTVLQTITTETFGSKYWYLLGDKLIAYQVPLKSFTLLVRFAIITPEFSSAYRNSTIEFMKEPLLNVFKGRPSSTTKKKYTTEINLWTETDYFTLGKKTSSYSNQPGRVSFIVALKVLYQDMKKSHFSNSDLTRDDVLFRRNKSFTLWHFVTFVIALVDEVGTEKTLFALIGILWSEMVDRNDLVHPWIFEQHGEDQVLPGYGMRSIDNEKESEMWMFLAGVIEMVLFQETKKHCLVSLQFDFKMFQSNASMIFWVICNQFEQLRYMFGSLEEARHSIEQPKMIPLQVSNEDQSMDRMMLV